VAVIRYIAFISEKPEELTKFYNRFLGTRARPFAGGGHLHYRRVYNLTFFKRRPTCTSHARRWASIISACGWKALTT
jgi:hypothetical protein